MKQLTIRLEDALYATLGARAAELDRPLAWVVVQALMGELDSQGVVEPPREARATEKLVHCDKRLPVGTTYCGDCGQHHEARK